MAKMSAGKALIEALRVEDVSHVFGIVGSCMVEFMDEFHDRQDIHWIGSRHEQGASHMADGYARVSGKVGVCMATNGPGATNIATGLSVAKLCHSPVLAMTGASMLNQVHREGFQEIDHVGMFKPLTKWTGQVPQAARIPEIMRHAFRIADSGKKGPVHVDLPRDLFNDTVDVEFQPQATYREARAGAAHSASVNAAVDALLKAQRPVIVAGLGVGDGGAQRDVLALAEMLTAAVVTSYSRNDAIPTGHAHVLGAIGRAGSPEAKAALKAADVILAVGTRLSHFTTMYDHSVVPAGVPILQIEIDPREVGRNYPVAVGMVGDAGETVRAIIAGLKAREAKWPRNADNRAAIAKFKDERTQRIRGYEGLDTPAIQPRRVHAELRKVLPRDTIIAIDGGTTISPVFDMYDFDEPRSFVTSGDQGCLGFAYPAAIGAKMAAPHRPVVTLNGDGSFMMNAVEIETALRCKAPVVAIILNNNCWGSEKAYQKYFFAERYVGSDITNPRFDKFAELFGGKGYYVERATDIGAAVAEALKQEVPTIVEIPVDAEALERPARNDAVKKDRQ